MSAWHPPARSAEALAMYAAAEADRRARPQRYALDPESVLERALRGDDISVLGDGDWRAGFEHYLASAAADGRLNALGRRMAADSAAGRLRARIEMRRYREQNPGAGLRPLLPPIVIIGGWRTGTTFLQRLLASDPRLRALYPFELSVPWRAATATAAEREAMMAGAEAVHAQLHRLNPAMKAIHDSGARLPEECVLAMGTDFRNWGFTSTTRLDGYAAWLAGEDFRGAYRLYREMLQALDAGDGRRFLLKAPAHTAELSSLLAAFPGACVVHLHRDIVETVASAASLFAVFRSTYSDDVDAADVGRFQSEQTALWLARAVAYRDSEAARDSAARFVDLDYRELVREPLAAVRRVYRAADLELTPAIGALFERYCAEHAQHRHGRHPYRPQEFGLDPEELRQRFRAYELRFGLA